ncbi:mug86 [Candida pseudojiufengensis]|uniref:mug86 n=1 Tax=Candida pseudojiufengensis TaxID=497109 RepID=UPI0022247585|nr:mug86 [Candida pseudojiufengensis]KAI5962634.1 mug86 [Candida pseudojiufengensis]
MSIIYIDSYGIEKAYGDDLDQFSNAIGLFMVGWVIFTLMVILVTMKTTVAFCGLFVFLEITFILLAAADFTGKEGVRKAGGVFGVITSGFAWYNGFVGTATKFNSYITGKVIPLPGNIMKDKSKSET